MYEFLDDDRFQSFAFEARGQAQRLLPGPAQADPDAVDPVSYTHLTLPTTPYV